MPAHTASVASTKSPATIRAGSGACREYSPVWTLASCRVRLRALSRLRSNCARRSRRGSCGRLQPRRHIYPTRVSARTWKMSARHPQRRFEKAGSRTLNARTLLPIRALCLLRSRLAKMLPCPDREILEATPRPGSCRAHVLLRDLVLRAGNSPMSKALDRSRRRPRSYLHSKLQHKS
jgi:hypothetical protein